MKRFKLIISVLILSAFVLMLACGGGSDSAPAKQEAAGTLITLLPGESDLPGWSFDKEGARFFGPGNLWEYINGAADGFLLYGFQQVVTADYSNSTTGQDAVVDIYEMRDPVNAFGIYASERSADYTFEKIGVEGYVSGTSINFWAGKYYIKITAFEENESLLSEMRKLAAKITTNINSTATEPPELSSFPTESAIAYSSKYIPSDVLGQSYLTNGFETLYKAGSNEFKIMLISLENPEVAARALNLYKEFIGQSGNVGKDIQSPGEEGFVGEDGFYGKMMAVRSGNRIAVILSMPDEQFGTNALGDLIENLSK